MSLNKEAIQHIEAQALAAASTTITTSGHQLAVVPEAVTLRSLEPFQANRDRFRGALKTHSLRDFAGYVKGHVHDAIEGHGFVDQDNMAATVVFNLGNDVTPGHGDDTATLTLKPTAAYSAVQAIIGRKLGQQELAEWMEDWAPHIQAVNGDAALNIVQAINGIRKMTIKATSQRDSAVGDFSASRSAMDEIEAKSLDVLATALQFTTVPFEGLKPATITLRLSVLTGSDTPVLKLRWVGEETQREEFAREFKAVLEQEVAAHVPLTIGTFSLGK